MPWKNDKIHNYLDFETADINLFDFWLVKWDDHILEDFNDLQLNEMFCSISLMINLTPQAQLSFQGMFGVWTDVKVLWTQADEGETGM